MNNTNQLLFHFNPLSKLHCGTQLQCSLVVQCTFCHM